MTITNKTEVQNAIEDADCWDLQHKIDIAMEALRT
jgi:hypothetical protein